MPEAFIDGFCKVEFLCYAGDPNWLGWIFLAIGGSVVAAVLLVVLTLGWLIACDFIRDLVEHGFFPK